MEYRTVNTWATRVIEWTRDRVVDNVVLASLCVFGTVPLAVSLAFFALVGDELYPLFVASHLLATVVAVVAPLGIWYYDRVVYPRFFEEMRELTSQTDDLDAIGERYHEKFRGRYWLFAGPLTAVIVGVVVANPRFYTSLGVTWSDPAAYVYVVFAIWWSLITAVGFNGIVITIQVVHDVGDLELRIDPLHPDNLGGLSVIGTFAIWTTTLASIGSLTIPLAFTIASEGRFDLLVYLVVVGYMLFMLVSFAYPTLYVNQRAQETRERHLEEKRQQIRELQATTTGDGSLEDLQTQLRIQTLREDFHDYRDVRLYPLSVGILSRLVSSILLPLVFLLTEAYLSGAL